jgi:hypothetical protein
MVRAITVKAKSAEDLAAAEAQINELLSQRHRIGPRQEKDFTVRNLTQMMEAREQATQVMGLLLAAIASVSLLVGGIGIMNIMLVSVTERTSMLGPDTPLCVENDPLPFEESPFHRRTAAAETADAAAAPDHAMTGDDQRKGVQGHGVSNGPGGSRRAQRRRQPAVRDDPAPRDFTARRQRAPHKTLHPVEIEVDGGKIHRLPSEKGFQQPGDLSSCGRRQGAGEFMPDPARH